MTELPPLTPVQQAIVSTIQVLLIFGANLGLFTAITYVERRLLAFMQFRLGPNRTGPFGLLQPVADGIKLFFKEELMPESATRWLFFLAPALSVASAFLALAVVPYGAPVVLPRWGLLPAWLQGRSFPLQIADLDVGLLYIFAITALGVYGIVMAGWASNNKYTLLGGLRSSAQMFSYELALGLSWVGVIMLAGSFRIQDIVASQQGFSWGLLPNWNVFRQFPAFVIYLIAATAECARIPFDLPEGEAELVAGFHTEYSSMKFAMFQMGEYINLITVSALASNLFFGGWLSPVAFVPASFFWFLFKVLAFLFFFIWLRGTLPRFRYDQLMQFGWKLLVPAAAIWILTTAGFLAFGPAARVAALD